MTFMSKPVHSMAPWWLSSPSSLHSNMSWSFPRMPLWARASMPHAPVAIAELKAAPPLHRRTSGKARYGHKPCELASMCPTLYAHERHSSSSKLLSPESECCDASKSLTLKFC